MSGAGYAAAGRQPAAPSPAGNGAGDAFAAQSESYELRVNGRPAPVRSAWIGESLLYVLRERLGLPGAKNACEQGECGSCAVLLDGALVCSCCVLAADAIDAEVTTIEGLPRRGGPGSPDRESGAADEGTVGAPVGEPAPLTDVQAGFLDTGAVQCGFCTPGLVMAVHDLLDAIPDPTDLQVREAISGNLCRCTGYGRIFAAVRQVQQERAADGGPS